MSKTPPFFVSFDVKPNAKFGDHTAANLQSPSEPAYLQTRIRFDTIVAISDVYDSRFGEKKAVLSAYRIELNGNGASNFIIVAPTERNRSLIDGLM